MKNVRFSAISLLCTAFCAVLLCQAKASEITVSSPPNKYISPDNNIVIKGKISDPGNILSVRINGTKVLLEKGGLFTASLILSPGKNLAVVTAADKNGSSVNSKIKILHTVRYPDMDALYAGRPHWAKRVISDLATAGIIEAFPDGSFMPDDLVTRGEFATWLCRAKALTFESYVPVYADVPSVHWRAPYIYAASNKGYIEPLSKNVFGIDEPLSRIDAAYSITKAVGISVSIEANQASAIESHLTEVKTKIMDAAIDEGLIVGVSKRFKMYDFSRNITRAEAANLISRMSESKDRVAYVKDWAAGYGAASACRVNAAPQVRAYATPEAVYADGKSMVSLYAKVDASDLVIVKADLKRVDGPSDAVMYDDASHGDAVSADKIYSIAFPVSPGVAPGYKEFFVTAVNKWGLSSSSKARLWVYAPNNPPRILSSISYPFAVKPGAAVVLAVKVYDADGAQDIDSVWADLSAAGAAAVERLVDDATLGDVTREDLIYMKEIRIPLGIKTPKLTIPVFVKDKSGVTDKSTIELDII